MISPFEQTDWKKKEPIWNRIRPYRDGEVTFVCQRLLSDDVFCTFIRNIFPDTAEHLFDKVSQVDTIEKFKTNLLAPIVEMLLQKTSFGCDLTGKSNIAGVEGATIISNHRDIVMDSAILNYLFFTEGLSLPRMAMGDNLLVAPWIEPIVKLADAVIVERSLPPREFLLSSSVFSTLLHYSIEIEKKYIWIAQREGRAKDANDRTQPALLKMMALANRECPYKELRSLNIVPLSISYEYDPCDYLKAKELYARETLGTYTKKEGEDYNSMKNGVLGYKGRIHFDIARPLNDILDDELEKNGNEWIGKPALFFDKIASIIDRSIHARYRLYPGNYVADDLLNNSSLSLMNGHYSQKDKDAFIHYIDERVALAAPFDSIEEKAIRQLLLLQYANPLRNYRSATETFENKTI